MILREERIGAQRLILGDCLKVMPLLGRFDAVVTDPPYGLADKWQGGGGRGGKSSWAFDPAEARQWDRDAPAWVPGLAAMGECIVWGGNYFAMPPSRCWLVWDKKQNDEWTTGQCELAWTNLDRPVRAFRFAQCEQNNEGAKLHPTQKPLALMMWCLKWTDARTILDPFMGSGTTLVACQRMGRQGTGIELDPGYFDIACRRVDEAARQPDLLIAAPPPAPVQGALL